MFVVCTKQHPSALLLCSGASANERTEKQKTKRRKYREPQARSKTPHKPAKAQHRLETLSHNRL
jgi:hypothetical protein